MKANRIPVKEKSLLINNLPEFSRFFLDKIHFIFILSLLIFSFFFIRASQFGYFTDEYEQLTAGWFISEGMIPYTDFFSHHAPLPLLIGALPFIFPFAETSILTQRMIVLSLLLVFWVTIFYFSERKWRIITSVFAILSGSMIPVFNLQMHLANTYSTFALIGVLLIIFQYLDSNKTIQFSKICLILILGNFAFWSNISSVLGFLGLLILLVVEQKKQFLELIKTHSIKVLSIIGLSVIFPIFFIIKNSFTEFWWSVFTYNTKYYFPYRLAENDTERTYGPLFRQINQFFSTFIETYLLFLERSRVFIQSILGSRTLLFDASFQQTSKYFQIIFEQYFSFLFSFETILVLLPTMTFLLLLFNKQLKLSITLFFLTAMFWFRDNEVFHFGIIFFLSYIFLLQFIFQKFDQRKKSQLLLAIITILLSTIPLVGMRQRFFYEKRPTIDPAIVLSANEMKKLSNVEDHILIIDEDIIGYYIAQRLPSSPYYFSYPWTVQVDEIENDILMNISARKAKIVKLDTQLSHQFPKLEEELLLHYTKSEHSLELFIRN